MKKLIATVLASLCLAGCGQSVNTEHAVYMMPGHYYVVGEVITEDGNIWAYSQDIIGDEPSYDNKPVYVLLYDAGTPNNIYDDEIVGLVGRD